MLDRVAGGETLTITRAGVPVAELRPLRRAPRKAHALVASRARLPRLDASELRNDLDAVVDPAP